MGQDQSMVIQINASIPPHDNPSIEDLKKYIKNDYGNDILNKWRHSIDATNNAKMYTSLSLDKTDKLLAEKIRSTLLKEYKANKVDVSQKIDANSFSGSINTTDSWSFSSNSTLFILCAVVLCGGIIVGFQKKFPFKYQNVYSKLTDFNKNNAETSSFESISIQKYNDKDAEQEAQEKDLNVNIPPKPSTNSAELFLQKLFKNLGTPSFMTSKYIQSLKDDYVTSIEQLREFDDGDWKRYGFKKNHIIMIKNKLRTEDGDDEEEDDEDDDEDDDDLSFDDDDGWNNDKNSNDKNAKTSKQADESTTDFDDF